ncbi:regulator of microtubule dynamics protein 1 isoform X4 [Artibeus jamaicensis]|uniref:regulator of microtubule dynamics protein 1 isoform X4 n=1 Tax=Artibeus jamaicensis TaxID=9417 RepID=UPI00187CA625|nr:regulator of microtubule dynamics protein 1 isoform X4 [Artibeus jamaicensis]
MALASRLWRFRPSGRNAAPGLGLPRRVTGGRGTCMQGRSGSEVAAEFWLTGRARAGHRGTQVIGNPPTFKRSLIFSALSYLGFETYQLLSSAAVVYATAKVFRVEEILQQADYLYESGETAKLYQLLIQYKESEDAELLWRLARASRDVAQLSGTSEAEKKVLVYEALEYAKRALEKNEASFAAHKWYAICISDVGDYEGIKAKIANAYVIKEHFEKAIELNPKDATSIHLMGVWCYTFAEMPWYQRRIANMLFAAPPSSTYEEALGYFQRAEQVDPNFYSKNLLLLGKTYLKLQNKKLAAFWLLKAKDYPAHTQEDKQIQAEAAQLLTGFSGKN